MSRPTPFPVDENPFFNEGAAAARPAKGGDRTHQAHCGHGVESGTPAKGVPNTYLEREFDFAKRAAWGMCHPLKSHALRAKAKEQTYTYVRYVVKNALVAQPPVADDATYDEMRAATLLAVRKCDAQSGWFRTFVTWFMLYQRMWIVGAVAALCFVVLNFEDPQGLARASDLINPFAWPAMHSRHLAYEATGQLGYRNSVDEYYKLHHNGASMFHPPPCVTELECSRGPRCRTPRGWAEDLASNPGKPSPEATVPEKPR
jgi:hypothetical protein